MKRANKFEPLKNVEGGGGGLPDPAPAPEAGAPPAPAPSGESPPSAPPVEPSASPQIPQAVLSRIGELTRKNREAQEREAALQAELAAARQEGQAPQAQAPTPAPTAYDEEIVNRRAAEIADLRQWNDKAVEIWNNGSGKFQDFGVNVNQMVQLLGGAVPRSMTEAAIAVGEPETVLYELSKNLGEAARIAVLPPAQQGAEIAKFAQKIKTARAPQVSNAPAPITPQVGGAGTVQSNELSDDLPIGEWMARRNKQSAGR